METADRALADCVDCSKQIASPEVADALDDPLGSIHLRGRCFDSSRVYRIGSGVVLSGRVAHCTASAVRITGDGHYGIGVIGREAIRPLDSSTCRSRFARAIFVGSVPFVLRGTVFLPFRVDHPRMGKVFPDPKAHLTHKKWKVGIFQNRRRA